MLRRLLALAVYMSADEVERADAFKVGYRKVCQHPNEIDGLKGVQALVIDFNQIHFDDHELAVHIANDAARQGVLVGIHTYYPEALKIHRLATLPNVLVAKTHRRLLHQVARYAKRLARPRHKFATAAKLMKGTVNHVHHYASEGAAQSDAGRQSENA